MMNSHLHYYTTNAADCRLRWREIIAQRRHGGGVQSCLPVRGRIEGSPRRTGALRAWNLAGGTDDAWGWAEKCDACRARFSREKKTLAAGRGARFPLNRVGRRFGCGRKSMADERARPFGACGCRSVHICKSMSAGQIAGSVRRSGQRKTIGSTSARSPFARCSSPALRHSSASAISRYFSNTASSSVSSSMVE